MKRFIQVGALGALLLGWAFLGDSQGAAPKAPLGPPRVERPGDDVQDVVFFSESRPVLLRLHLRVDGKAFRVVWEEFMDKLFRYLDVDGDGVLSKAEAERAPPVQALFNTGFGGGGPPKLAAMDTNRDGKVSRAELADYYRRNGAAPFQFGGRSQGWNSNVQSVLSDGRLSGGGAPSADDLNERLFKLLDKNKDGKLSRAELSAAPAVLARLDADDDEMLTPAELMGNLLAGGSDNELFVVYAYSGLQMGTPTGGPFHLVSSDRGDSALARRLLTQYGGKGARKLTAKALGLDKATFDRLDADGDGELDAEELARFARRAPDLEFVLRLGERGTAAFVEHVKGRRPSPMDRYVVQGKDGQLVLDVNNTRLDLGAVWGAVGSGGGGIVHTFDVRQQYAAQFKAADKDNNGYLDEAEARQSPFFRNTFKLMDRDGDGMLYLKEVLAYAETMKGLSEAGTKSIVSLSVSDEGKGLFELLDTDKDGRLSVRELRQLPKLLERLDREGKGYLTKADVPRNYRATFEQGTSNGNQYLVQKLAFTTVGNMAPAAPPRTAGPLWFRKMDRNRDGDVSRREFLGTDEEFRRIDTDGDGLIGLEEAVRYDKLRRERRKE